MEPNDLFLYFALAMGLGAAPVLLLWGMISLAKRKRSKSGRRKLSNRILFPVRAAQNSNTNSIDSPYQIRRKI
jgi:hypothetical protein